MAGNKKRYVAAGAGGAVLARAPRTARLAAEYGRLGGPRGVAHGVSSGMLERSGDKASAFGAGTGVTALALKRRHDDPFRRARRAKVSTASKADTQAADERRVKSGVNQFRAGSAIAVPAAYVRSINQMLDGPRLQRGQPAARQAAAFGRMPLRHGKHGATYHPGVYHQGQWRPIGKPAHMPPIGMKDRLRLTGKIAREMPQGAVHNAATAALVGGGGLATVGLGRAVSSARSIRRRNAMKASRKGEPVKAVPVKKSDTTTKPSGGRLALATVFAGPHGLIAGKKGVKMRTGGREYLSSLGGMVTGHVAGAALGAATRKPELVMSGAGLGRLAGSITGAQRGFRRNNAMGRYKPESTSKSWHEVAVAKALTARGVDGKFSSHSTGYKTVTVTPRRASDTQTRSTTTSGNGRGCRLK